MTFPPKKPASSFPPSQKKAGTVPTPQGQSGKARPRLLGASSSSTPGRSSSSSSTVPKPKSGVQPTRQASVKEKPALPKTKMPPRSTPSSSAQARSKTSSSTSAKPSSSSQRPKSTSSSRPRSSSSSSSTSGPSSSGAMAQGQDPAMAQGQSQPGQVTPQQSQQLSPHHAIHNIKFNIQTAIPHGTPPPTPSQPPQGGMNGMDPPQGQDDPTMGMADPPGQGQGMGGQTLPKRPPREPKPPQDVSQARAIQDGTLKERQRREVQGKPRPAVRDVDAGAGFWPPLSPLL